MAQRRTTLKTLAGLAALGWGAVMQPVQAQQRWPERKPIRIIVPYAAGGSLDTMTRELAAQLATVLNQQVVIENRPGASTMIGTQAVARAEPDGYTLLSASSSFVTTTVVYKKPLHKLSEFAPVTQYGFDSHLVVVNPTVLPVHNLAELVAYARANPGKVNYGTAGTATSPHLEGEELAQLAGIQMLHVPFNGSAPALTNLVGGQIGMMVDAYSSSGPHIKAGRLRAIAVTGRKRLSELPDVPTVAEQGYPSYDRGAWDGILAPAGTPADVIQRLQQAIATVLQNPTLRTEWTRRAVEPVGSTPAEFARFLQEQLAITQRLQATLKLELE